MTPIHGPLGIEAIAGRLPDEFRALLCLDDPERLAEALVRADPVATLRLAKHHRLAGPLGRALDEAGLRDRVDPQLRDDLDKVRRRTQRRYVRKARPQLQELSAALDAVGVQPIALKGVSLVEGGWLRSDERRFSDLDVLISPDQLTRAAGALSELGYRPRGGQPRLDWARANHYQDPPWERGDTSLVVDLHHHIVSPRDRLAFDRSSLRSVRLVRMGSIEVHRLDDADQVDHLILHFWRDRMAGRPTALGQLWDIHRTATALTSAGQARLLEVSAARGHAHLVALVLSIAQLTFGTRLEAERLGLDAWLGEPELHAFILRRVLVERPAHAQLLMPTGDVDYTAARIATRLAAQIRRPTRLLEGFYGPAGPLRLRLRHLAEIAKLLARFAGAPRAGAAEIALDRWVHGLGAPRPK